MSAYYAFSRQTASVLARIFSFTSRSVAELLLYAGAVCLIFYTVLSFRQGRFLRPAAALLAVFGFLLITFFALWGLHYRAAPLSQQMELTVRERPLAALEAVAAELALQTAALADSVPRNADGVSDFGGFDALRTLFGHPAPKRISNWRAMSMLGLSGIYLPWTGEATVNPDTPDCSLPFTMAHELAHRDGVAPEDEANFVAFLTCRQHESPIVQYSGYFSALLYAANALFEASPSSYAELWHSLPESVQTDIQAVSRHWAQYEGPVQRTGESFNDSYLKAMGQSDGVKSYGAVADLLIADYVQRHGEVGVE